MTKNLLGDTMVGRVFISCGQRPGREKETANKIGILLKEKFSLESYIAINVQSLNDIMKITQELRTADYYLFIDFLRRDKGDIPFSLFTHQELALAHNLGFNEMIAFKEEGAPIEGFLRYVQSNPEPFSSEADLLEKIEVLVRERKWNKDYSRNLVLENISAPIGPFVYADHTGQSLEYVWHAKIRNRRPDAAAVNTVCILDSIEHKGKTESSSDRSNIKWARQIGYQRTIFPEDYGLIDIFALRSDREGIFLHSALDSAPRQPILTGDGKYRLNFKVFSESFPLLPFAVNIDYHYSTLNVPMKWENLTNVSMAE
jgi:hypothetical protein